MSGEIDTDHALGYTGYMTGVLTGRNLPGTGDGDALGGMTQLRKLATIFGMAFGQTLLNRPSLRESRCKAISFPDGS